MIGKKGRASIFVWYALLALLGLFHDAGAQGFGNDAGQTPLNDSLLKFTLYGREWVHVGYRSKTATGGAVGADTLRMEGEAVIRGDLLVHDLVDTAGTTTTQKQVYKGSVSVDGSFLTKVGTTVAFLGTTFIADHLLLRGSDTAYANVYAGQLTMGFWSRFYDETHVSDSKISTAANSSNYNTFGSNQVAVKIGEITANNESAEISLNEGWKIPEDRLPKSYSVPEIAVNPNLENNCTVKQGFWWTSSMCSKLTATVSKAKYPTATDSVEVLPPGRYGDLVLEHQAKIMLGEGIYEFNSISNSGTGHMIFVHQPNKGRTQILVANNFKMAYQDTLMMDTTSLKGGTILIYQGGTNTFTIGQDNVIFATLATPNAQTSMGYGSKLFGQIWAKQIELAMTFEADDGLYIPFSPANPVVAVDAAKLLQDEGNSGSIAFPITFKLNYMNGRDVTVYFHTTNGTATATDYTGVTKDSVVIKAGRTSIQYAKILVLGDKDSEPNETFRVVIDSVANGETSTPTTVLTIVNDDGDLKDTTVTVAENTTAIMTVPFTNATTYTLHYMLAGGADMALFALDEAKGVLTFKAAPNFERPGDADKNSVYEVKLAVCFQSACTDQGLQMTVHVKVTDVVEPSVVVITAAETKDSSWAYPDTVYVNSSQVHVFWTRDGEKTSAWDSVALGKVNLIVKTWKGADMDTPGADSLVVVANNKKPVLEFEVSVKDVDSLPDNMVAEAKDPKDTLYYTNDPKNGVKVNVTFIGKDLRPYDSLITLNPRLQEGTNNVCYTATDAFGNSATGCVGVVLDTKAPVVKITSPQDLLRTLKAVEAIAWTVDGDAMDTLLLQSLVLGTNTVVRSYQDLAGNVGSDTVLIHLREQDDISLDLEKELVVTSPESIKDYYAENPPRKDEQFTVSIINQGTGLEEETAYGKATSSTSAADENGNVVSKESSAHLGPTLVVKMTLPLMGGVDAAGNNRAGSMLVLQDEAGLIAVTAGAGTDRVLVPIDEYVEDYCLEDAFVGVPKDSLLYAALFRSSVSISFMIYDATGQFVDQIKVTQDIADPDYLDDNGQVTMFIELKPTLDGLASSRGRLFGTGVYIVQGQVNSRSVRLCDMPTGKKGEVLGNSNDLLEKFGYKRVD